MMQEFVHEVKMLVKNEISEIHTALPGVITEYSPSKGLASVRPTAIYKKPNGDTMMFPTITGVPVVLPQTANQKVTIAFPVKAGDSCLIIFSESALDYWLYGKQTDTMLRFDLSNAICIPGLYARAGDAMVEACSEDAVIIDSGGARLKVKKDEISIVAQNIVVNGDLKLKGNIEAEGMVSIGGDVGIKGMTTMKGDVGIEGTTSLTGDLDVDGSTSLDGNFGVEGDVTMHGAVGIEGDLDTKGDVGVEGVTTLKGNVNATGDVSVDGSVGIEGAATVRDTLDVGGVATLNGDVTIEGVLTHNNSETKKGGLTMTGSLSVSGTAGISGDLTASNISLSRHTHNVDGDRTGAPNR